MEEEEKLLKKLTGNREEQSTIERICTWLVDYCCNPFGFHVTSAEKKKGLVIEDDGKIVLYDDKKECNKWKVIVKQGLAVYDKPKVSKQEKTRLAFNEQITGKQDGSWVHHEKGWSRWYYQEQIFLKKNVAACWWKVTSKNGLRVRDSKRSKNDDNLISILPCGTKVWGKAKDKDKWLYHTDYRYPLYSSKAERKLMNKYSYKEGWSMIWQEVKGDTTEKKNFSTAN